MQQRQLTIFIVAAAMIHAPTPVDVDAGVASIHTPKRQIRFEANDGQWDHHVRFVGRGVGAAPVFITDEGLTVGPMTLTLVGTIASAPIGEEELVTKSNFFVGSDPGRWRVNVPNYARVRSTPLTGVDVVWHGDEYDLVVAAGVDARALTVEIRGARESEIEPDGSLALRAEGCALVQRPPLVNQGGRNLRTQFVRRDATHVGFAIDDYDPSNAVLIDPVFTYSTYLGGSNYDAANAIAVDASGSVYTVGTTYSTDFPTVQPFQSSLTSDDVFVTKLNTSGSALVYSTYLGGSAQDTGVGVAIDSSGNVYLTGTTSSTDFPTYNAVQSTIASSTTYDTFVSALDASGSALLYSTYLGGSAIDKVGGIAVDGSGTAYVAGYTTSTDYPTTAGAIQTSNAGGADAFVSKLSTAGALAYSTYVGGTDNDYGYAIAVSASGAAYVAGNTASTDFPTQSALQPANAGNSNAFISVLNTAGDAFTYSTYLGGSNSDFAKAIAVDSSGSVYVVGYTNSSDFPTKAPLQASTGGQDCFIAKVDSSGSSLIYASYLGGNNQDYATGIAVDSSGFAYLAGYTSSNDFPLVRPMQVALGGTADGFVALVDPFGASLVYSTYVGGGGIDRAQGIAVDAKHDVYIAGWTASTDYPTANAFQNVYAGSTDAFVSKITTPNLAPGTPCTIAGACASNNCVDGVCCNVACDSQCEACDVDGQLGACTPVAGPPHGLRKACGGSGACAGTCGGALPTCTFPTATVACGSTCSNASEIDSVCNGDGGCVAQPAHSCGDLACADDGRCSTQCTTSADCAPGLECYGAACLPPPVCVNDHRSKSSDGTTIDCTPYTCGTAGTCNSTCLATADCVVGWVCDGATCVLPPYAGGCSCNESNESPPWLAGLLAMLVCDLLRRSSRTRRLL